MVSPLASSFKWSIWLGLEPFQVEVNPVIFCKQNTSLHFIIKGEKDEALINPHKPTLCQTAFLFTKNTYYMSDYLRVNIKMHDCFW